MTNQEYKDYLIKNGAYPDFEIVNSPVFDINIKINGQKQRKQLIMGSLLFNSEVINILNNLNEKWYIYNDYKTDFTKSNYIRMCNIPTKDRLYKHRLKKINEIKDKLDNK